MNCDSVFKILTSGPFPTGLDYDEEVETHISRCDSCRMFSEALRPAPDLFHESLDSSHAQLPSYHSLPVPTHCCATKPIKGSSTHQNDGQQISQERQAPLDLSRYSWPSQVVLSEPLFQKDYLTILTFLGLLSCTLFGIGWVTAG